MPELRVSVTVTSPLGCEASATSYVAVEPSVTVTLAVDSVIPRVSLSVTAAVSPGMPVRLP